jgi:hypothetical protein
MQHAEENQDAQLLPKGIIAAAFVDVTALINATDNFVKSLQSLGLDESKNIGNFSAKSIETFFNLMSKHVRLFFEVIPMNLT